MKLKLRPRLRLKLRLKPRPKPKLLENLTVKSYEQNKIAKKIQFKNFLNVPRSYNFVKRTISDSSGPGLGMVPQKVDFLKFFAGKSGLASS